MHTSQQQTGKWGKLASHSSCDMATIKIDNAEYDTDHLSDDAKAQVVSLQFVQQEVARLEAQIAVFKTAEAGYAKALKEELSI